MIGNLEFCREMRSGEEAAVTDLLSAAFVGEDEVKLVEALRDSGAIAGEMVLPGQTPEIVGYYALSYFVQPRRWLCLAPVAIHPVIQRQRNGKRMMGQLSAWAEATRTFVVVLGQSEFYAQCGFSSARAARLTSPFPVTHTLLAGPGDDAPEETLIYPEAFASL